MSGIIHMVSGKTWKISDREMANIAPKMQAGGVRLYRISNGFVPLNSNTMEFIERIDDEPKVEPVQEMQESDKFPTPKETNEEPKESDEQKAQRQMDMIMAKSNCKHEAEKLEIYTKQTTKGARYFPVCSFCGKRERYVKADSLTDEQKSNAKVWSD